MIETFLRIIALTRKELLAILKDPRTRLSLVLPPILQCLIYGYVATYDLNDVAYAVLDKDRSAASRELLSGLDGSGVFRRVADLQREDDIRRMIDEQRVLLVIQIEQDFARRLMSGGPADVQIIADGRNSNTAGTAMSYVNEIVEAFNADWRAAHNQGDPPLRLITRAWYNPNLETRWHMIPALLGMLTLLETILLTGLSVAREREQGTFDQLLVTPFRPVEIMIGKAMPPMLVGIVQATLVLLVAQLWFRIPFAGSFVYALHRADHFLARRQRYRFAAVVGGRNHAAGHALFVHADHAFRTAFRFYYADHEHAGVSAILHVDQPAALRHRNGPSSVSRRGGPAAALAGALAARADCGGDTLLGGVDVSPPAGLDARSDLLDCRRLEWLPKDLSR